MILYYADNGHTITFGFGDGVSACPCLEFNSSNVDNKACEPQVTWLMGLMEKKSISMERDSVGSLVTKCEANEFLCQVVVSLAVMIGIGAARKCGGLKTPCKSEQCTGDCNADRA